MVGRQDGVGKRLEMMFENKDPRESSLCYVTQSSSSHPCLSTAHAGFYVCHILTNHPFMVPLSAPTCMIEARFVVS